MSLTSFLSQTVQNPVNYAQGMSQSSTTLPSWYNDYTQNILNNAAQFANQGYQQYQGPRVAGPTADQQTSYGTIAGQQGAGSGAAQQGMGQVANATGQPNALSAFNPYAQNAATPLSSQMQSFMNPYLNQVVNATDAISARNFNNNVMPGLQDQFTRAGQVYGGSQQGVYAERLGQDEQLNEQMANGQLMAGGFNTALGGAQAQAGINAGLAGTAASAANAAQNTGINAGMATGQLGIAGQNAALQQATMQNQAGQQQQQQTQGNYNTAYQDFLNQTNWPLTASQALQSGLQGVQVPTGQSNYSYQPYGVGQSPAQTAGSVYSGINSTLQPGGLLYGLAGGQARGGHIRFARGGLVKAELLKRKKPEILTLKRRYDMPLRASYG